jgi:hypothetical protein
LGLRTLGMWSVSVKPNFGGPQPNREEKRTRNSTRRLLQSRQILTPTCSAYRCPDLYRRTAYHSNSRRRAPLCGLCLVCVRKRIGRCQEQPYLPAYNVSLTLDNEDTFRIGFSLAVYPMLRLTGFSLTSRASAFALWLLKLCCLQCTRGVVKRAESMFL